MSSNTVSFCLLPWFALVVSLLVSRLAYIQIIKPDKYIQQADANFRTQIQVNAPRGVFYDRSRQNSFRATRKWLTLFFFDKKKCPKNDAIQSVAKTIEKPIHYIHSKIKQSYLQPKYIPIVIKRNLYLFLKFLKLKMSCLVFPALK